MAYIKLAKAGTAYDIISADDIISCKLDSGNIIVSYSGGTKSLIVGSGVGQADVQKIIDAAVLVGGTNSPAPLVTLSTLSIAVTGSALS